MGQANGKLLEMHARQRLGMPDSWRAFNLDTIRSDDGVIRAHRVIGAVVRLYPKGGLIGRPDWASRNSEQSAEFTPGEHESWVRCWESRTGLCRTCLGSGREIESAAEDTRRQCRTCEGSGRSEGVAA